MSRSRSAIIVPMGYATQMRAMQDHQCKQEDRIAALEKENAELKSFKENHKDMADRVHALEQHDRNLAARRRECVSQLLNLRTMNQEASNAFDLRAQDIQPDDLEGVLMAYATSITSVLNHHQRVFGQMRANGQLPTHTMAPPSIPVAQVLQAAPIMQTALPHFPYPPAYTPHGWCRAHNAPYRCRICGW
ncbi:hypothetical protein EK21DRAFT_60733 [Setomelanomma holmii]|uniref:Uncharacterized protein n=1 Tax=Setomelanomma holmii TaxID=210430 RepID=A0A9P4HF56_9PLEO|nr:hypothetical protein EK21DRAFT_60733 [Setomelanomma holmii]